MKINTYTLKAPRYAGKLKTGIYIMLIVFTLLTSTPGLYADSDTASSLKDPVLKAHKPKVVLVLSGGSARGIAHIGVLSVLEEYNIPIDLIIGVSMGSIVGGYYAYGYSPAQIYDKAGQFDLFSIINIRPNGKGLFNGQKEMEMFRKDVGDARIENLKIPLVIVATDLIGKKVFLFRKGPLAIAMRASSAIPGLFKPVKYKDHLLVDGGVLDDVPSDIAKSMGADIIIVSDVTVLDTLYNHGIRKSILTMVMDMVRHKNKSFNIDYSNPSEGKILDASLRLLEKQYKKVTGSGKYDADFVIKPLKNQVKTFDFRKAKLAYELGRKATLAVINDIAEKVNSETK
ncbi:MAG: hypothetical protein GXP33_07975 [Spirochaetes bacterium]|nr:hypothetical protein [Spirochaetota bacterium]